MTRALHRKLENQGVARRIRASASAGVLVAALLGAVAARAQAEDPTVPPPNRDAFYQSVVAKREALLAAMTPVTDATLRKPPAADWLLWRGDYDSTAYSSLSQIDKTNAGDLRPVWSMALSASVNEQTPLVHDGVLFIQAGLSIQALNAATGERLWEFSRTLAKGITFSVRDFRAKYLGLYGTTLYAPTSDGYVVALDAKTGKLLWERDIAEVPPAGAPRRTTNFRLNSGPLLVKGKVIVGVSSGNSVPGGSYIVGLDAKTGEQLWRFHTIARPGQPGGNSWNGVPVEQRYGGGVWTGGSYDPARDLVFFGVGNTYNVGALMPKRSPAPGSNDALYTNATVALDPDTGKLVWYYQHFNRDLWDLDWVFERTLLTLPVNGKQTDILLASGKLAMFDAIDRRTGKYLFSTGPGARPAAPNIPLLVSGVEPGTGRKIIAEGQEAEFGKIKMLCPNVAERNWPATAYDTASTVLFLPLQETCYDFHWVPRDAKAIEGGGSDIQFSRKPRPDSDGKFGRIEAVDLKTGNLLWAHRQRAPIASSLLVTGGGLLFAGDYDRMFRAHDAKSGAVLWETPLPAAPNASPVTFTANGEQYIAVVSGSGGPGETTSALLTPERSSAAQGISTLHVFRLARK